MNLFALIFFFEYSYATVYYVSSSGNDSNSGTTEQEAWKTLSRVNKTYKFEPGDRILFRRGDEWVGKLVINTSGSENNPITFGAYGTGKTPVIYGSQKITGWTKHSGNIYKAEFKSYITQLFLNNERIRLARFPNDNYTSITSISAKTTFTNTDLPNRIDYKGATCVLRTAKWKLENYKIANSVSNTLTIDDEPIYELKTGTKFFICNKLEFLDSPGEWFYDSKTDTIYLWTPNGDSPENYTIRGSTFENGVDINEKNFITIRDIEIRQHQGHAVNTNNSNYLTIENVLISDCEGSAIYFYPNYINELKFENNIVQNIGQAAIFGRATNSAFKGNIIENISVFDKIGIWGVGTGGAISINGDNNTIKWNRINNIGYSGISFNGENTLIENNYIESVCNTITDGGGIYTYTGQDITKPGSAGSIIRGNLVLNCIGEKEESTGKFSCNGIYLDEGTHDVTVEYNTVSNIGYAAIFLNITSNNTIIYNTVFDAPVLFLQAQQYKRSTIQNNIFVTAGRNGTTAWWNDEFQRLMLQTNGANGRFDYNTYVSNYAEKNVFHSYFNFLAWKTLSGQDKNSSYNGALLKENETERLFYNDTRQAMIFHLGNSEVRDINGKLLKDTFSLAPFTSRILIGKDFSQINRKPQINDQTFNYKSPGFANDTIAQVFAFDPDTGQIILFSYVPEIEEGIFSIDSITGKIFLIHDIQIMNDTAFEMIVVVSDNLDKSLSDSARIRILIEGTDSSPPEIQLFSLQKYSIDLTVPVLTFAATDDKGIAGFLLTDSNIIPLPTDSMWSNSPPTEFTFSEEGTFVVYAWARDSAGNISTSVSDTVVIKLPDLSPVLSMYLFDEESGIEVFDSNSAHSGNIVNGEIRTSGVLGQGIGLSGTNYINLGESFGANVKNEVTLSAWIKPESSNDDYQSIIAHEGPNSYTFGLFIYPRFKRIAFITIGTKNAGLSIDRVNELWDGNWHYIVATYNGSEKIIYLDGEILIKTEADGPIEPGFGYNLLIGADKNQPESTHLFQGTIDDVRIYNYAIEPDKVVIIYDSVNSILKKAYVTESVAICEGDNYLGWFETGEYTRILQRKAPLTSGADSIVITHLTVNPAFTTNQKAAICEGEIYNFGSQKLFIAGDYVELFNSANGCDSIVNLTLSVNPSYYINEDITITEGENYLGWTENGTYERYFNTINGCDSLIITNLTVDQNNNLETNLKIFSASEYPDFDSSKTFMTSTGNTSALTVSGKQKFSKPKVSVPDIDEAEHISIYPNPANDFINIEFYQFPKSDARVMLFDTNGNEVLNMQVYTEHNLININNLNPGLYFIKIVGNSKPITKKLIIN